jgi:hypothetical protein
MAKDAIASGLPTKNNNRDSSSLPLPTQGERYLNQQKTSAVTKMWSEAIDDRERIIQLLVWVRARIMNDLATFCAVLLRRHANGNRY